jgi:hypothetical protein
MHRASTAPGAVHPGSVTVPQTDPAGRRDAADSSPRPSCWALCVPWSDHMLSRGPPACTAVTTPSDQVRGVVRTPRLKVKLVELALIELYGVHRQYHRELRDGGSSSGSEHEQDTTSHRQDLLAPIDQVLNEVRSGENSNFPDSFSALD